MKTLPSARPARRPGRAAAQRSGMFAMAAMAAAGATHAQPSVAIHGTIDPRVVQANGATTPRSLLPGSAHPYANCTPVAATIEALNMGWSNTVADKVAASDVGLEHTF